MHDAEHLLSLGQLVLRFGRVERVTYHEDGKRRETDTDHTVMLGLIACSIAEKAYPNLDVGKVAQYALVHDLVEAYAGDTPTFNISEEEHESKAKREAEALARIEKEFTRFPWLVSTLHAYETLGDPEARFVKTLDKCMPKITHILNKGTYFKEHGKKREELEEYFKKQHANLESGYGKEFPELLVLVRKLMDMTIDSCFPA